MANTNNGQNKGDQGNMANMSDDAMLRAHKRSYQGFVRAAIWGTGCVALLLILMALFLV